MIPQITKATQTIRKWAPDLKTSSQPITAKGWKTRSTSGASTEVIDGLIALALEQREAARARKDFSTSDSIRDHISGLGITLEDTPSGPRWSITPQGK